MHDSTQNSSLQAQPGHLYVVATPIGNLADITERAKTILGQVDIIACEDTRTTGGLLKRLEIAPNTLSAYHDHNEIEAAEKLADQLRAGKSVAVVSDAGTPALKEASRDSVDNTCSREQNDDQGSYEKFSARH